MEQEVVRLKRRSEEARQAYFEGYNAGIKYAIQQLTRSMGDTVDTIRRVMEEKIRVMEEKK